MTELLDHGYLKLVGQWGSDEQIVEAARMSTAKGFKGWGTVKCSACGCVRNGETPPCRSFPPCQTCGEAAYDSKPGDEKLLRYLYEHKHSTPFEMAGLTIEVKAPIFVFRQWHRHRTQSYNEMSARYTPLPAEDYVPGITRLLANSSTNKQAGTTKGSGTLSVEGASRFRRRLGEHYESCELLYQEALAAGVPKELARVHLPVARYSRMRASANLRNWLAFLTLRMDPHAQYEIRVYAEALGKLIAEHYPRTWELFAEGLQDA